MPALAALPNAPAPLATTVALLLAATAALTTGTERDGQHGLTGGHVRWQSRAVKRPDCARSVAGCTSLRELGQHRF